MASVTSFCRAAFRQSSLHRNRLQRHRRVADQRPPTVDFARFNGLQSLIDMNDVAVGTYNCVSISLGNGNIGYLDTSQAPSRPHHDGSRNAFPDSLTYPLCEPNGRCHAGAPVGLHMDFDLRKSISVDSNGNITGDVTPTFTVKAVNNHDPGAYIDEFDRRRVTPHHRRRSFTIQGPHGRTFTVNVTGQTEWDGGASLSSLNSSSIVQISGSLDRADATIDADEVGHALRQRLLRRRPGHLCDSFVSGRGD